MLPRLFVNLVREREEIGPEIQDSVNCDIGFTRQATGILEEIGAAFA
jgi:hypothetical protein